MLENKKCAARNADQKVDTTAAFKEIRRRYAKSPQYIEYQRKYKETHTEERRAYHRAHYLSNIERHKANHAKWMSLHGDAVLLQAQKCTQNEWEKEVIHAAKNRDIAAGRTWEENEYINIPFLRDMAMAQHGDCIYCANAMCYGEGTSRKASDGLTSQRIDNDVAHTMANTVLCCHRCNCITNKIPYMTSTEAHELMLTYGPNLNAGWMKCCCSKNHIGGRVMIASDFRSSASLAICGPCRGKESLDIPFFSAFTFSTWI